MINALMELQPQQTSEFNDAVGYLGRINLILYYVDEAHRDLNPDTWLRGLELFYSELVTEMKDEDRKRFREISKKIAVEVNRHTRRMSNTRVLNKTRITQELVEQLKDYETELRDIYKKSGLQMKLSQDSRHAIGR